MSTGTRGRPALIEALEGRTLLSLAHGIDPNNMGKGDWIWQVASAENNTGTTNVAGLMSYLKAQGLRFVIVKAGDGDSGPLTGSWKQFNTRLIDAAHAAGLKIFGYHFIYGGANGTSTQAGEKKVAREIMSLNPDGMVIDAEGSYETVPDNQTVAADYCKSFRAMYPTTFLAHAPFAYASLHRAFPYEAFNKYCDAIMPQDYWFTISRAQTPEKMVADMDREWGGLYAEFRRRGLTDAIKPIVPIGQGYDPSAARPMPADQITRFLNLLRFDPSPASPGGYNGASFWSVQHHTPAMWSAIAAGKIGKGTGSISGTLYNDLNGNGIQDGTEVGIRGRTVYMDRNNNGVVDLGEPTTTTTASGFYKFRELLSDGYKIRQVVPLNWQQTTPKKNYGWSITLFTGQAVTQRDFGVWQNITLRGSVFFDGNGNRVRDTGEGGLAGWTVFVDRDNDGVLDIGETSAATDANGNWAIFSFSAGTYSIRLVQKSGWRRTTQSTFVVSLPPGGVSSPKLFGEKKIA